MYPNAPAALAVDIGGGHATCAVIADGRVHAKEDIVVTDARRLKPVLSAIADTLYRLVESGGFDIGQCAGLAMSFPGIVDPFLGQMLSTPRGKYDDSCDMDLPAWCREHFALRFRVENDARMALLGERYAGAARGFDDVVTVTLGTGVGGAAMIGGRLLRGKHFQAGCLGGHLPVAFAGRECICGAIGCVEAEASTWALPAICKAWPGYAESELARERPLDFGALFRCCEAQDRVSIEIRERCIRVWSAGAVGLIHAYDPEVVVFGGAVMKSAAQILPQLKRSIEGHSWTPWGKPRICAAELGPDAALIGALPLLMEPL